MRQIWATRLVLLVGTVLLISSVVFAIVIAR
jgi:hypothetical protein